MYILGLNAYHADSSAAIFKDGKMIAATEEERFRRVKHWAGFPSMAVEFCLREAGISLSGVDHIAIGRDPYAKLGKKLLCSWRRIPSWRRLACRQGPASECCKKVSSTVEEEFIAIDPGAGSQTLKKKIHQVEHHRSHLASGLLRSPLLKRRRSYPSMVPETLGHHDHDRDRKRE